MVQAKILVDSICGEARLTTFQVEAPRFILCEINTHGALCRSAASSRAIPVERRAKQIESAPAEPAWWCANARGMQGVGTVPDVPGARLCWQEGAHEALARGRKLAAFGLHKQIANRPAEPYAQYHGLITGTEWANFFNLRVHEKPDPTFDLMALTMLRALNASTPKDLKPGQWHMPFGEKMPQRDQMEAAIQEVLGLPIMAGRPYPFDYDRSCLLISTARCARLSYETHNGDFSYTQDLRLGLELWDEELAALNGEPVDASPSQHQAQAVDVDALWDEIWNDGQEADKIRSFLRRENARMDGDGNFWWGQLKNWRQFRKTRAGENCTRIDGFKKEREGITRWNERVPDGSWDSEKVQEALDRR